MIDYLSKSFNLTLLDLIIIAIIGGLFVNFLSFIIKKIFATLFKYISGVRERFKGKIEGRKYQKRILNNNINNRDMLEIYRKKDKATKEELEALNAYRLKEGSELSDEQRERMNESIENMRNQINNSGFKF